MAGSNYNKPILTITTITVYIYIYINILSLTYTSSEINAEAKPGHQGHYENQSNMKRAVRWVGLGLVMVSEPPSQ